MLSLFRPFRPDPFKFRPPKIKRWLYGGFHLQNYWLLFVTFKLFRINISHESLQQLKRIKPGSSTLILSNHVGYIDPHVLLELAYRASFCAKWIAGIEPFDTARGIFGWFIQSAGAFSIDRGTFDRRSLEAAQEILDEGTHPLVIFPEGEAACTNKILQPFYSGAALFALNTAEKQAHSSRFVQIVPIGIRYQFIGNPEARLRSDIRKLWREILKATERNKFPMLPESRLNEEVSLWEQLLLLAERGFIYLQNSYNGFSVDADAPLTHRLETLRDFLLSEIVAEHHQPVDLDNLTLESLMTLKNRLRSNIARKRYAPSVNELQEILAQVHCLAEQSKLKPLSAKGLQRIKRLEKRWIGISLEQQSVEKRFKALTRHLTQQIPYAEIRDQATPEDLARWERQMNDTRRIKMLTLLISDLQRRDESWEGIDETLIKLEILLFSRFVYRGNKQALVRVGEFIDVKRFILEQPERSKKQLQEELMQQARERIQLLIAPPAEEPMIQNRGHAFRLMTATPASGQGGS